MRKYVSKNNATVQTSYVGSNGEITVDPDNLAVRVHDGITPGGFPLQGPTGDTGNTGPAGIEGPTGSQGPQGQQGDLGPTGPQGVQGFQGTKGDKGDQGNTGPTGLQGDIGPTGADSTVTGPQGDIGPTGAQGEIGPTGADSTVTGPTGFPGAPGVSTSIFLYKTDTTSTAGSPATGRIQYNNVTQTTATALYLNHVTIDDIDIGNFIMLLSAGQTLVIQDKIINQNVQTYLVTGDPVANIDESVLTIPVSLVESSGTGTTGFGNNTDIFINIVALGATGPTGAQGEASTVTGPVGETGPIGDTGPQGIQGETGPQGSQGLTGPQGIEGPTGAQGIQGDTGPQGVQGFQGIQGIQGPTGWTGPQGIQGIQGLTGATGYTGITGPQGITANQTLNSNSSVTFGNVSSSGNLVVSGQSKFLRSEEAFATYSSNITAGQVVTLDCTTGQIFNVTSASIAGNWTANFTNLTLDSSYASALTIIINQPASGTAYIVSNVQIGGSTQTINWQSGSQPTGNLSKKDSMVFSILNNSGTYVVLGQLVTFG